ncbi:hypothetical protein PhCBS80983_g04107 [Powellomyces hirtus]|uniref:F-box domain-containing protein n=1 Tax=Powellomyces hirtus TaxID=109895 RepID=A0A507E114_9FUNG|nr:hypothetical protein PhCBS80983_g04107 [Powellomyces hirtus]
MLNQGSNSHHPPPAASTPPATSLWASALTANEDADLVGVSPYDSSDELNETNNDSTTSITTADAALVGHTELFVAVRGVRRTFRLPPEILTHVLRYAYTNSRRQFLNNALVDREWAACALPVLWERIAPRSNFPLALIVRSLDKLWRTLSRPGQSHDYASFPRAVAIQLHLKNNEFISRRSTDDFARIVELVPGIIKYFPKVRDLGLTLRVEEVTIPLQATATAFLERLIRITPPSFSLWLKLAGIAVLDSQCAALAEKFGPVLTDLHLTKCMGCTAFGLKYLLKRSPRLQSLALYIPSLHDQLLGTIAEHNNQLMDLWLDLPMEEGAQPNDLESLRHFCDDLRVLMQRSKRLRRLRLRGVPLNAERAQQMLSTVATEGKELRSLSVLVWPPVTMGREVRSVAFTHLNKLIISSNNRLSNDFIIAVARSCPKLTYLDAGRTRIDDTCVHELAARCPNLEFFDMSRCPNPTIHGLSSLARHARNLEELDVSFCPKILRSEDLVPFLHLCVGCKKLKRFSVDYPPAGGVVPPDPPLDVGTASETVRLLFSRFGTISADTPDRKRVLNLTAMRDNWTAAWRAAQAKEPLQPQQRQASSPSILAPSSVTLLHPLPPDPARIMANQFDGHSSINNNGSRATHQRPGASSSSHDSAQEPAGSSSNGRNGKRIVLLSEIDALQPLSTRNPNTTSFLIPPSSPSAITIPPLVINNSTTSEPEDAALLSEDLRLNPVVSWWIADVKRVLDGDEESMTTSMTPTTMLTSATAINVTTPPPPPPAGQQSIPPGLALIDDNAGSSSDDVVIVDDEGTAHLGDF